MYKELGLQENVNILKKEEEQNELKAAIVFTVFARLLDKNLYFNRNTYKFIWFTNGINLNLDGYLYYYLVNGNPATYSKIKCNPETQGEYDTLLLFAHGGISLKFIETKDKTNNNKTSGTGLDLLNKVSVDEWKKIANIDYELTQKGGNVERAKTIIDHIKKFNKQYNDKISELFSSKENVYIMYLEQNNDVIYPSPLLQVLLSICTPADNNSIIKNTEYLTGLSPIQISSPKNNLYKSISTDNRIINIINIFSHIPSGTGYTFGYVNYNMNFINTDYSHTLLKDNKLLNMDEFNKNYLIMYLNYVDNTYKFTINGVIYIKIQKSNIQIKQNMNFETDFIDNKQFVSNTIIFDGFKPVFSEENINLELEYDFNFNLNGPHKTDLLNYYKQLYDLKKYYERDMEQNTHIKYQLMSGDIDINVNKFKEFNFHGIVKLHNNNFLIASKQITVLDNKYTILVLKNIDNQQTSGGYYNPKINCKKIKTKTKIKHKTKTKTKTKNKNKPKTKKN